MKRPKLAAVTTVYRKYSHAQHIIDRFLEGYGWNGAHHHPPMDLVALFVDQVGSDDLSRDRAARFPQMKIYPTGTGVAYALRLSILSTQPGLLLKIFGYGAGAYVSVPNYVLLDDSTIPGDGMPRHALIKGVPLLVYIVASVAFTFAVSGVFPDSTADQLAPNELSVISSILSKQEPVGEADLNSLREMVRSYTSRTGHGISRQEVAVLTKAFDTSTQYYYELAHSMLISKGLQPETAALRTRLLAAGRVRSQARRAEQQGCRFAAAFFMSFLRHREIYPSDGGADTEADAPTHRLDEFPAGYSSAGCSPAEPASASPAGSQYALQSSCRSSSFQRTANSVLTVCVSPGGKRIRSLDQIKIEADNTRQVISVLNGLAQ